MPSKSLAAFAATYAAAPLPGTHGTPSDSVRGSGPNIEKTAENSGFQGHGTPGTRGTPKNDDAGEIEAAPVVSAMPSPSAAILVLFPADPAIAPSPPPLADGRTAALAAAVAALGGAGEALPLPHWPPGHWRPRRYTSDLTDQLWTTMARPISWADPAARPEEGAFCSNCEYATWARDKRGADGGWCCSICHPADHIPPADRDVVRW